MASPYIYQNNEFTATSAGAAIPLTSSMLAGSEGDIVVVVRLATGESGEVSYVPVGLTVPDGTNNDTGTALLVNEDGNTSQFADFYAGGETTATRPRLYASSDTVCHVLVYRASFGNY